MLVFHEQRLKTLNTIRTLSQTTGRFYRTWRCFYLECFDLSSDYVSWSFWLKVPRFTVIPRTLVFDLRICSLGFLWMSFIFCRIGLNWSGSETLTGRHWLSSMIVREYICCLMMSRSVFKNNRQIPPKPDECLSRCLNERSLFISSDLRAGLNMWVNLMNIQRTFRIHAHFIFYFIYMLFEYICTYLHTYFRF